MDSTGFDWAKIGVVATGATVMGVVLGTRGGSYFFEIGDNLLMLGLVIIPATVAGLAIRHYFDWRSLKEQLKS